MTAHTTQIRPWLLGLGCLFAVVTTLTILKDVVIDGADWNLTHLQAVAAMVAAIAAGHLFIPALLDKRLAGALGLGLVFLAATGYIVVSAGARNAETAGVKAMEITKRNAEREAAREVLAKAEADTLAAEQAARDAVKAAAAECATGKGTQCRGKEATREAAKDDLAAAKSAESLARGKLLVLGPDENPYEGYHHAARTFEAIGIGSTAVTEAKLELLMPFALVLISELATLIFFGLAFGHVRTGPVAVAQASDTSGQSDYPAASDAELANVRAMLMAANDDPSGPDGGSKIIRPERWAKDEVLAYIQAHTDRGENFPSQRVLSALCGIPTSTLSEWCEDWENAGLISRVKVGRRKMVG